MPYQHTVCNMCRHLVAGGGNCCVASLSFNLSTDYQHRLQLQYKGLEAAMSTIDMAMRLRELAVKEWIHNSHRYEPFLAMSIWRSNFGIRHIFKVIWMMQFSRALPTYWRHQSRSFHLCHNIKFFCITPEVERSAHQFLLHFFSVSGTCRVLIVVPNML